MMMQYELPKITDDTTFDCLIRDIARRVFGDPSIERLGRSGQRQFGIDGIAPGEGIAYQCKQTQDRTPKKRDELIEQMDTEFERAKQWPDLRHFIFASTFDNDTSLQKKAAELSTPDVTVDYWGWGTITEKIWEYREQLIPVYYPIIPIKSVSGFFRITLDFINRCKKDDKSLFNNLALDFYQANSRPDIVLEAVCNDIDVRNNEVLDEIIRQVKSRDSSSTLWILGDGGSGKSTTLYRLAVELAQQEHDVYLLNLEENLSKDDLESILSTIKYGKVSHKASIFCIDNPAADDEILDMLLKKIPSYSSNVQIVFAERSHRYESIRRLDHQFYINREEKRDPIEIKNKPDQREKVFTKLIELLRPRSSNIESLKEIFLREKLSYVEATYEILSKLKKEQLINFKFDWEDYEKSAAKEGFPAFKQSYRYIALFSLFGVKAPFSVLAKRVSADKAAQESFLERFRGVLSAPVIMYEREDDSFRRTVYLKTRHEVVSQIFFKDKGYIKKENLLVEWCRDTDFDDIIEVKALIRIFSNSKNYLQESAQIDFQRVLNYLLNGELKDKIRNVLDLNRALHLGQFWLFQAQEKYQEAISVLDSYIEKEPENIFLLAELAKAHQKSGNLGKAEELFEKIVLEDQDDIGIKFRLSQIYQQQEKWDKAIDQLCEARKIDSKDRYSLIELAKIYEKLGKLDMVEETHLKHLDIRPNNLMVLGELARLYQKQKDWDKAIERLEESLKIDRSNPPSLVELARIYQHSDRLDLNKAKTLLLEVLEIERDNIHAHTELGKVYRGLGEWDTAIEHLKKVLELDSNDVPALSELGITHRLKKNFEPKEAERLQERVLSMKPHDTYAMAELLKIWRMQRDKEKCVDRFLRFIRQEGLGFGRGTQIVINEFFRCCESFNLKEDAKAIFQQFETMLDDRNKSDYKRLLHKWYRDKNSTAM